MKSSFRGLRAWGLGFKHTLGKLEVIPIASIVDPKKGIQKRNYNGDYRQYIRV